MNVKTYEVEEENYEGGASGEVEAYAHVNLEYPCMIIEPPLEKYKIKVFSTMFASVSALDEAIHLYFKDGAMMVSYGTIGMGQVNSLLKLFNGNKITGYLSAEKVLTGDKLYCLGILE